MQAHTCWEPQKQWFTDCRGSHGKEVGLWVGDSLPEEKHCSYPPLPTRFMKALILLFTLLRDGWVHSTCFLQSSCVCFSCPLPFSSISPFHSTCCGCWVGLRTLVAFHASNSLITHTHTHNCQLIAPQSSPPPLPLRKGEESQCFGYGWPELGYKVVLVLTVGWQLKFWGMVVHCHAVGACCGYFPASGWTYSCTLVRLRKRDENEWKAGEKAERGMEMCCIQTTEWHTSPRPVFQLRRAQDCSQTRLLQTAKQKESGEQNQWRRIGTLCSLCFGIQNQLETKPTAEAFLVEKGICSIFCFCQLKTSHVTSCFHWRILK